MGYRGRFLFFTAAEYFRKVQTWLQNVQSNLMLRLHGMQGVHSRLDMLASGGITSAHLTLKTEERWVFSLDEHREVLYKSLHQSLHSGAHKLSIYWRSDCEQYTVPHAHMHATCFSHLGSRTPFSVSSQNVASQSSVRHVCHAAHTFTTDTRMSPTTRMRTPTRTPPWRRLHDQHVSALVVVFASTPCGATSGSLSACLFHHQSALTTPGQFE